MFQLPLIILSDSFSLQINEKSTSIEIIMQTYTASIQTTDLPLTSLVLTFFIPDIFNHDCFNQSNLSFLDEVGCTEVGHLFEHILLEYLTQLVYNYQGLHKNFKGETKWNWRKDPYGSFHIVITGQNLSRQVFFKEALTKSVYLIELIYQIHHQPISVM